MIRTEYLGCLRPDPRPDEKGTENADTTAGIEGILLDLAFGPTPRLEGD